jgi:hypothetical protein
LIRLKVAQSGFGTLHPVIRRECAMPLVNELFLALVLGAFVVFAAALAYGSMVASGKE